MRQEQDTNILDTTRIDINQFWILSYSQDPESFFLYTSDLSFIWESLSS